MQVTIVGLGLVGGSIARSLRRAPDAAGWRIDGWSPRAETRRAALDAGAIDRAVPFEEAITDTELLVLAAPPLACLSLVDELGGRLRDRLDPHATVTDVASTKSAIVERADRHGLRFVGGHPMAGRETTGFDASVADLFVGRPWVIVRGRASDRSDVDRVAALALACGAEPVEMTASAHDEAVAGISHAPLILSSALVETVCGRAGEVDPDWWPVARQLAAGGWRDMTRIARGDPAMGAGIVATNARPVAQRLRRFRAILDEWIEMVEDEQGVQPVEIEARFAAARARLAERAP